MTPKQLRDLWREFRVMSVATHKNHCLQAASYFVKMEDCQYCREREKMDHEFQRYISDLETK